ncbi:hypothetical protein UFOVP1383_24 [uncultured Caudovirales phage]|uniref:Uncharacterized protein n=1 Tax=uncultured Caudovirales phage TaxID=2100421 RepID=A0A6J5SMX9_9CAUD|nr:hypothetical protein UFOVP848_17 [uncultured Caudovirales phage]CAB4173393.1 hypothetical protein UFOVP945_48 [uncultured Caudovirales phage]CAB4179696.1 hypothetical protein UFOVP1023_53 [uncultured Caudovirales phage]CAB4204028.1 hypothetical protein UFOVP1383_24 [uncultured Caudovirales phage]CAB4215914.1 hypothetical protein UFOVP1477_24 [uncultured Caudovirales phage]
MAKTKVVQGEVIAPFNCWRCLKKLADAAGPGTRQRCRGCGAQNQAPTLEEARQITPPEDATRPSALEALHRAED